MDSLYSSRVYIARPMSAKWYNACAYYDFPETVTRLYLNPVMVIQSFIHLSPDALRDSWVSQLTSCDHFWHVLKIKLFPLVGNVIRITNYYSLSTEYDGKINVSPCAILWHEWEVPCRSGELIRVFFWHNFYFNLVCETTEYITKLLSTFLDDWFCGSRDFRKHVLTVRLSFVRCRVFILCTLFVYS